MNRLKQEIISSAVSGVEALKTGAVKQQYRFSPDFVGFSGHFPGYPILPAFIQILMAVNLIEQHLGSRLKIATVEKAKFHKPLGPDQNIEVECQQQQMGKIPVWTARISISEGLASGFKIACMEKEEGS
jgi:3-hydroxyacyl-[acyl-carrier-protein] dehydratase